MSKRSLLALAAILLALSAASHAADNTGRLGLNYTLGPSFILGGDLATDASSVEPGVGAGIQLGITPNLDARFDYDYVDATLHSQALTFGAQWGFAPTAAWNPFAGAGIGFGKPYAGEGWDHFSLKLEGGMQMDLTANVAIAALLKYQFIDGIDPFGSVHTMEPGVRLTYFFGRVTR
jgi:opacity protein-like surface antigen